jgi:colicin import membrane protein
MTEPRQPHYRASSPRAAFASVLLLALACASGTAFADDKPGASKALRRLQIEAAHAQQEKAAAEAEKADLAVKLDAESKKSAATQKQAKVLANELAAARRAAAEEKAHAEALQAQTDAYVQESKAAFADMVKHANENTSQAEAEIAALRQHLAEAEAHGRSLEQRVQGLEADQTALKDTLGERTETISVCEKKNGELFALNADLRQRYQSKGFLSLLKGSEPLTGLARVKEENALQAIEDQAYDAQIRPGAR